MNEVLLSLFSGAVGAVLAVFFADIGMYRREQRATKRQIHAVRQLLIVDLTNHIETYEKQISRIPDLQFGTVHAHSPSPFWNQGLWSAQLPIITEALTAQQFMQVVEFYTTADLITGFLDTVPAEGDIEKFRAAKQDVMHLMEQALAIGKPLLAQLKRQA